MRSLREIPESYKDLTWEDYKNMEDKESMENVKKYAENLKIAREMGINLLLIGKVGTGKTGLCYLILKRLLELRKKHIPLEFGATNVEEIVDIYTQGWRSDEEKELFDEKIRRADFLIIDDVGKEFRSKSGLTETIMGSLIRHRVQWKLPIILTSNVSIKGLEKVYGSALASVMLERTIVLSFIGEDFRKKEMEEIIELFKERIK